MNDPGTRAEIAYRQQRAAETWGPVLAMVGRWIARMKNAAQRGALAGRQASADTAVEEVRPMEVEESHA